MKMPLSYDERFEPNPVVATHKGYADVLALVTSSGPWSPAAFAGVDIAAMFNAHVTGCYIDPSLRSLAGIDDEPTVMALLMDAGRVERDDYDSFAAFARSRGVRHVSWENTQVAPAKTMRALGAWHDLIVLERDLAEASRMIDVLGEALLTCRAPCLVLPPRWDKPIEFKRMVIGWNGSIESIRAIHAALPLAALAEQVVILKDGALALENEGRQLPFDPVAYLRSHGVRVGEKPLYASPINSGRALLRAAMRQSADCLVMGAYGHARVRERILGGATRHILQNAEIPILLQH
ncbi:MAG TPA: universal stress protein [Dyella sp.]|uniref:universal stress protein n=1 Tax=Dyella sp. TaxID=1869338 RepID=UPI002D77C513|nr:universal stress protein [Dyella sp.]HET6553075.1 universal stress protein [Dyella sp.]